MGDDTDIHETIAARVAAISEAHTLSTARREAVELAYEDLVARGEWPPSKPATPSPPRLSGANGPSALDAINVSKKIASALRARHVEVTGPMHLAIREALES